MDNDMILVAPFSVRAYLEGYAFAAIPQDKPSPCRPSHPSQAFHTSDSSPSSRAASAAHAAAAGGKGERGKEGGEGDGSDGGAFDKLHYYRQIPAWHSDAAPACRVRYPWNALVFLGVCVCVCVCVCMCVCVCGGL